MTSWIERLEFAPFLLKQRWFAGKSDGVKAARCVDSIPIDWPGRQFELCLIEVELLSGSTAAYVLPLSVPVAKTNASTGQAASSAIPECSADPDFWRALLTQLTTEPLTANSQAVEPRPGQALQSRAGRRLTLRTTAFEAGLNATELAAIPISISSAEQSNTSVRLGSKAFLKLFRRAAIGINPDAEIGRRLTGLGTFQGSPRLAATLELSGPEGARCIAMITELVVAECDAWSDTLRQLSGFWARVAAACGSLEAGPPAAETPGDAHPETDCRRLIGSFLEDARLLGQRTAELHVALTEAGTERDFETEPFTAAALADQIQRVRQELSDTVTLIRKSDTTRTEDGLAEQVEQRGNALLDTLSSLTLTGTELSVLRCHGDYHLGQVLRTADDFQIIDFEGEPERPLDERRQKRCAYKDVAGMVRSLHYASNAGTVGLIPPPASVIAAPSDWQRAWFGHVSAAFLDGYESTAATSRFMPADVTLRRQLLDLFLLEKVLYELRYELGNRPDWIAIPLAGLKTVLGLR